VGAGGGGDATTPLTTNFEEPRWVTGESKELNYRGNAIKRDKLWFQRNPRKEGLLRYAYTGWTWGVSAGTYRLGTVPALEALVDTMENKLGFAHVHNAWIITKYSDGKDNIGMHSDKTKDWAEGSKDVEIYNQVLQPGTAVIVGMDANQKVKHGVPAVAESGPSGSIVGRCITTTLSWDEVREAVARSEATRARAARAREL
jgi:hypothetical protein